MPREQLQSAVRLTATARYLGMLIGPAVGGGILLSIGPSPASSSTRLLYLPPCCGCGARPTARDSRASRGRRARLRGLADIVSTLRAVAGIARSLSMTLLAGGASLFIGNAYQAQMPEFAHDLGHGDADLRTACCSVPTRRARSRRAVLLESRGLLQAHPRTAFILAMLWCCALAGFALSHFYLLALALLFVAGFVELSFNSMAQTLVQLKAPPDIRGRVIGLYSMAALGLRTFSGVTVGIVGGLIGIHWSLALSGIVLLFVMGCLLMFSMRLRSAET